MTVPVEAQSLSSLFQLLANPPHYPRNPTHQVQPPLILYIVRVPGRKDVFLTPLKPATKASISLSAIQSSLYYLHVQTPDDEEVKRSIEQEYSAEEPGRKTPLIVRKPLPSLSTNYRAPERPNIPPKQHPSNQPGLDGTNDTRTTRFVAHESPLRLDTNTGNTNTIPLRRPVNSGILNQPPDSDYCTENQDSLRNLTNRNGANSRPLSYMSGRSYESDHRVDSSKRSSLIGSSWAPPSAEERAQAVPVGPQITLIRRDPVTGNQWNIGTIGTLEPSTASTPLRPVSIEITTPGYGRFAREPEVTQQIQGSGSDPASIKAAIEAAMSPAPSSSPGSPAVSTPGGVTPFRRVIDFQAPTPLTAISNRLGNIQQRTNSALSEGKVVRGIYSFTSPWQGTCTFSNGIDGKSLRCRHTIPNTTSSHGDESVGVNVAELRFNLPWSMLSGRNNNNNNGNSSSKFGPGGLDGEEPDQLPIPRLLETKKENFRRSFQHFKSKGFQTRDRHLRGASDENKRRTVDFSDFNSNYGDHPHQHHHHRQSMYDTDANTTTHKTLEREKEKDADRISLKLGREKAGGGFQGRSAKLGKLIIEDEGLKMCDLVVAACMGVWWQHYDGEER